MCNCKWNDRKIEKRADGSTYETENASIEIKGTNMNILLNEGDWEAESNAEVPINYCPFCGEKVSKC